MIILSKLSKNKTLLNGCLFSIYSFVNQGTSFLLLIVLAKYILPGDYGRLSLFNTVVMFLGYFIGLSTAGYLPVSFFKNKKEEFMKDFTTIVTLSVITLIFFLLLAIALFYSKVDLGFPSIYLFSAVFIAFCKMIFNLYLDFLRIREKVKLYGLFSCSNAFFSFTLSLFFVVQLCKGWIGRINAQLICFALFAMLSLLFLGKAGLFLWNFSRDRYKTILMWGIPLIPHLASIWIRQGGDRYIINYYHTAYDVGLFSFALNLSSVIIMIGFAFNQTNSVSIYQILSNENINDKLFILKKQTLQILLINFVASIAVSAIICLIIPFLMPSYTGAISYFMLLAVYGFIQCLYFLFCNYLFYYNKTKTLMFITFWTSILHLLLSLLLTHYSLFFTCGIYIVTQSIITALVFKEATKLVSINLNS